MALARPTERDRPLPVLSWAMYDFANTIYSAIVVTAFLPHFLRRLTGRDLYTGLAQTGSMVLAGLLVPVAGALADRTGKTKAALWRLTVLCCAATATIGLVADDRLYLTRGPLAPTGVVVAVLVCFGLANLTYQASLVFYNSLLPAVASPPRQGRVSGLGVGLGYLGVVFALQYAHHRVTRTGTLADAFLVAGAAFFVASLPTFFFVRPPPPRRRERVSPGLVGAQFRELGRTLRTIGRLPPVLCFFLGNFLCVDVVNTLIMWTRPYLERGAGFTAGESIRTLIWMSVTAFVLGVAMGWVTDRLGSKRALLAAAGAIFACILTAATVRHKGVLVGVILVLGSGGLAGVWVAGRKFLLEIAPAEKVGEFFGLYGVTIKLSVLGCTLFAALADWASYRAALLSLIVPLTVGIALLALARPVRAEAPATERPGAPQDLSRT